MILVNSIKSYFGTGSIATKENAIIFTALTLQVSIISALVFSGIHISYVTGALITTDLLGAYFLKKRFSLKRDTNFDYFKKIQGQEIEIANLKKEIETLKAPKTD